MTATPALDFHHATGEVAPSPSASLRKLRPRPNLGRGADGNAGSALSASGSLAKYADNSSPTLSDAKTAEWLDPADAYRLRYEHAHTLLDQLRTFTTLDRLKACRRLRIGAGHRTKGSKQNADGTWSAPASDGSSTSRAVTVWAGRDAETGELRSGYANLQTCGSSWVCPVCAPKVRQSRAEEILTVVRGHLDAGGAIATFMLTVPHHRGQTLTEVWDALGTVRSKTFSGSPWRTDRKNAAITGYIRSAEVTFGANGWHPHEHYILLLDRPLGPRAQDRLQRRLMERIENALLPLDGFGAPNRALMRIEPVRDAEGIAEYLTKWGADSKGNTNVADVLDSDTLGLALEHSRADLKQGPSGGFNPWEIANFAAAGHAQARRLWREFERASHGRRSVQMSQGLKKLHGVESATDQDLADAKDHTIDTRYLEIEPIQWEAVCSERGGAAHVRMAMEIGTDAARAYLAHALARHVARKTAALARFQLEHPPPRRPCYPSTSSPSPIASS